jgi:hypothetical protein
MLLANDIIFARQRLEPTRGCLAWRSEIYQAAGFFCSETNPKEPIMHLL